MYSVLPIVAVVLSPTQDGKEKSEAELYIEAEWFIMRGLRTDYGPHGEAFIFLGAVRDGVFKPFSDAVAGTQECRLLAGVRPSEWPDFLLRLEAKRVLALISVSATEERLEQVEKAILARDLDGAIEALAEDVLNRKMSAVQRANSARAIARLCYPGWPLTDELASWDEQSVCRAWEVKDINEAAIVFAQVYSV